MVPGGLYRGRVVHVWISVTLPKLTQQVICKTVWRILNT